MAEDPPGRHAVTPRRHATQHQLTRRPSHRATPRYAVRARSPTSPGRQTRARRWARRGVHSPAPRGHDAGRLRVRGRASGLAPLRAWVRCPAPEGLALPCRGATRRGVRLAGGLRLAGRHAGHTGRVAVAKGSATLTRLGSARRHNDTAWTRPARCGPAPLPPQRPPRRPPLPTPEPPRPTAPPRPTPPPRLCAEHQ